MDYAAKCVGRSKLFHSHNADNEANYNKETRLIHAQTFLLMLCSENIVHSWIISNEMEEFNHN